MLPACTMLLICSPAQVRLVLVIVVAPLGIQHIVHGHHVVPLSHDPTAHTPQLLQLSRVGMRSLASVIAVWLPAVIACQHPAQQAGREPVGSFQSDFWVEDGMLAFCCCSLTWLPTVLANTNTLAQALLIAAPP